jgi:hypothetical protein
VVHKQVLFTGGIPEGWVKHSLDGHRFRQVAGLIDIAASTNADVISKQLKRNYREDRRNQIARPRYLNHTIRYSSGSASPSVTTAITTPSRAFTSTMFESAVTKLGHLTVSSRVQITTTADLHQ